MILNFEKWFLLFLERFSIEKEQFFVVSHQIPVHMFLNKKNKIQRQIAKKPFSTKFVVKKTILIYFLKREI